MIRTFVDALPQRLGQSIMRNKTQSGARSTKHVAMIFAVLTLSIANIGTAWGVDYSSTPLVSLDFSSSLPSISGVTYNGATYSNAKISWSGNYSKDSRDVQIKFKTTGSYFKLVIGHITSGSSMKFKYTLDNGSTQEITFDKSATSNTYEIPVSAGEHTISLGPGGSSTRNVVESIAIYDEVPSCTAPTNVVISGEYIRFPGETLTLTVSGENITGDATYTWKKGEQVIAGQTTAILTINNATITDAGNYTCTVSNGTECEATANYTVKMYSLRGLTDNAWTTDFAFAKTDATTATYSMELAGSSSYEFKIFDGNVYYGNEGDNPTMTSTNCTNWTMKENSGNNVTLQTTVTGTYTFTLNYADASNPTISITYPQKKTIYLNPGVWADANPIYAVHAWNDGGGYEDLLMELDCGNLWKVEVDVNYDKIIFIRGNNSYNISNPWDNVWDQTADLTIDDVQYKIGAEWNFSQASWTSYSPSTFTISFDANEGTGTTASVTNIACGSNATLTANAFTRTGYTFAGWATTANGEVAYADKATINNITSNITLYAKWTAEVYNITYYEAIGDAQMNELQEISIDGAPTSYTILDAVTLPALPDKTGYTATGWYTKWCVFEEDETGKGWDGCEQKTNQPAGFWGHTNFIVRYIPNTYTVTFNANGGTINAGSVSTYTYGVGATLPTDVTKDGFTFGGWYDNEGLTGSAVTEISTTATGNKTYWAKWTEAIGLTPTPCPNSGHVYAYNDDIRIQGGAYKNPLGGNVETEGEKSITGILSTSVTGLTSVELTTCYSEHKVDFPHMAAYIKAKTSESNIVITVADGYSGTLNIAFGAYSDSKTTTLTNTYADATTATVTSDQRSAEVEGAYTTKSIALKSGTNTLTFTGNNAYISHMDVVLQKPTSYTVTFDANGHGTAPTAQTITSGEKATQPTAPTADGYTFGGWYTEEACTNAYDFNTAVTANITLYAKWTVNSSSECITIAYFDASQGSSSNNKPDANAKHLYGYTDANKTSSYTITTNKSNNVGKNDGAELYLYYGTSVNIYADNTTTGGTPQDFSGITYISIDVKMVKSNYYSSFDIKVGDKVIADDISLEGTAQSNYVTFEYNVSDLDGKVTIIANGSSTNHHIYVDNIKICTAPDCEEPDEKLIISTQESSVPASQTVALSVIGGNEGPIAFTVTPATGAVTGNDGVYSFSATEVGDYVINATQADYGGVCGGNATCVISVTAIGSLTAPTITATDLNDNVADAFTFCETDDDDALKVVASHTEEGVTYTYQWYVKETDSNVFTPLNNATEAIYPPTMDGTYYCEVTATKPGYTSASANSKEWTITITQSTAIKSQPMDMALEGGQATLEVEAEGENLQYQWYSCEDDDKTNEQAIAGATDASYTTTQTGYYYVVVKSDCGVDRTSDVVQVTEEVDECFSMTVLLNENTKIDSQTMLTSDHADITGGTVFFDREEGKTMELNENGLKFGSNSDYLKVTLMERALINGTVIEFTYYVGSTGRGIKILKSDKTTEICSKTKTGSSGEDEYSFTITEDMQEEIFYITRVSGTAYLRSLSVSNCGAVCSDNTPTLTASTTEISASTSVTLTASNYENGATLTFYKEGVAEPLQTGAENTCTVTVDVTSTFYVVAVKDCERRSESKTVTFTCGTPQPKIIQVGGVLGCNETVTLKAVNQDGTDINSGTLQWYKDGVAVDGATATTIELDLEDAGEYTVSLTLECMAMSSNTAVVTDEVPEPELEVLTPRQYYRLNHDYTDTQKLRYLMKLTLPEGTDVANASNGAYQITATLKGNTLDATQFVENKIEEGVYWIMLNLNSLTTHADNYGQDGLAAGDVITIKVTPLNLCGEYPENLAQTVDVKVTDKPTLAFIVSGADGNGTKEKKSHKVNGDFLTGYNKADLCLQTGTTSFDNTQELPLYTYLKENFEVIPVNGYAPYSYYNYDPFDLLLLTDFPKTDAGVGKDTLISAANLNALADVVDKKPLLSLKTHMVKTSLGAWSAKGFMENPLSTKNQLSMTLLCYAHDMFKEGISITPDDEGNVVVPMLTKVGFDANKGMQGFRSLASTNFVNIATTINSADNTTLVASCERQTVTEARMLLLSINADATSFISDEGKIIIRNALNYLLHTDPTHVSDCSIEFDNGGGTTRTVTLKGTTYTSGDNEWGNPANWSTRTLPGQNNNVLIEADCKVTNRVYGVANVRINNNYTLVITPTGGLVSTGHFAVYEPGKKYDAKQITDPKYVTVQANETNTGLLMHSHQETLHATVQMYSPANHDKEGGYNTAGFHKVKNYTDVAVPVEVDASFFQNNGYEAQYWKWNEKGTVGFERQTTGKVPHFQGGCISHCDPQLFSFAGQVALAKDHPYEMTYTEGGWYGINVVGNSWTAPIQILELTPADFGSNLEQTIYIYNTGHDATPGQGVTATDFSTPGQWMAIPIDVAKTAEWAGPKVIPAMQAFQVLTLYPLEAETSVESRTLTIGYNKHIRCRGAVNGLTQKLYAPQRPKKAPRNGLPSTAEVLLPDPNKVDTFVTPTMLRVMFVADSVKTDVYLFEDDQRFKNGFDNGWDGTYQNDETVSGAYVLTEAGNMAISAQPYLEGTTVALKSKKTTTFQCTFKYTGTQTLYLNDTKLEQSTKIEEGASYVFMASPEDAPNRFVISAEPYQGSITGMAGVVMVDNALVVNNPLQEPLRVFIYDAVGRTHHVYDTKAAMEEINLPNVPGVYLIRLKGENTDLVHKVVR